MIYKFKVFLNFIRESAKLIINLVFLTINSDHNIQLSKITRLTCPNEQIITERRWRCL